jgi:hypothetical protein
MSKNLPPTSARSVLAGTGSPWQGIPHSSRRQETRYGGSYDSRAAPITPPRHRYPAATPYPRRLRHRTPLRPRDTPGH